MNQGNWHTVKEWTTEAGLPAVAKLTPWGTFNGYIAVPEGHPLYGVDTTDTWGWGNELADRVNCAAHGSTTYADLGLNNISGTGATANTATAWWLGFDCAHHGDFSPVTDLHLSDPRDEYPDITVEEVFGTWRSLDYVIDCCEAMAREAQEEK